MGTSIHICGLNGSGKSTLGKALAERTGFHFIDSENLYFPEMNHNEAYKIPRSREEAEKLLAEEISKYPDYIFAAVKGDYGKNIIPAYDYVIWVEVPKSVRMQRVRNRSFLRFGSRMLPGGDLFEQEEAFFRMVDSRRDDYAESWLKTLACPVIRVDGTEPIDKNVEFIRQAVNI